MLVDIHLYKCHAFQQPPCTEVVDLIFPANRFIPPAYTEKQNEKTFKENNVGALVLRNVSCSNGD